MNREEFIKEAMVSKLSEPIKWNINREFRLGKFKIKIEKRDKDNFLGRFGGGWNWNLGFQVGGNTFIINLLIGSIRISYKE